MLLPVLAPAFFPALPVGLRWGLSFIWQPAEDGHQQDSAPGETFVTWWGVTQMIAQDAVAKGILTAIPADGLTQTMAATIYLGEFWQAMLLDAISMPIAFCLFCDATLTGQGHVAKLVQRIVGANPDGVIGRKQTIPAIARYVATRGVSPLIDAIITADETYEAALANAPKFINGWTRREEEERGWAQALAGINTA